MKQTRLFLSFLAATLLSGLIGCDVAVVAVLASRSKSSGSSTAPAPDLSYELYVANFANPAAAAAEQGKLQANGGNPSSATWTFVGRATATTIWTTIPAGNNSALIQGPLTQVYNIDAFERLNANKAVVEVPIVANIFSNQAIVSPASAGDRLDGQAATTDITNPAHIPCIFAFFTQNIGLLRVRIWGANQTSGDCVWSNKHELANADNFVVGGAVANSSGTLYTTYTDTTLSQSELLTFASDGTKSVPPTQVAANASTTGNLCPRVDSSGNLFIAASLSTGQIQLQKYAAGSAPAQWTTLYTGVAAGGVNQVGSNGLGLANNVPLLSSPGTSGSVLFIAGGQGVIGSHTLARFDDTPNAGTFVPVLVWGPKTVADPSSSPTSWSGVATSGTTDVLTTGNLSNTTTGNIEIYTQDSAMDTGNLVWPSPVTSTSGGAATNSGKAISIDGQGSTYVAGNFGSAAGGKDSVLLRYKISDGSGLATLYKNSTFIGPNEFLGIAVDADGTSYVAGYVTLSELSSTTSMWIGKFPPAGGPPLWTATFNNGVGNDQAISVSLSGAYVYVVGQNTVAGPKNGMRVFKFLK